MHYVSSLELKYISRCLERGCTYVNAIRTLHFLCALIYVLFKLIWCVGMESKRFAHNVRPTHIAFFTITSIFYLCQTLSLKQHRCTIC